MAARTNATADVTGRGVLRPTPTAAVAAPRRDYPVTDALAPFVERYWSVRWDLTGRPPFRAEVLSHPSVNLSVEDGSHRRFGVDVPTVLLHGVVSHRFMVDLTGWGVVTAAKFRPGGFTAMTGRRVDTDTVTRVGVDVLSGVEELLREVTSEPDDRRRAAHLDRALLLVATDPEPAYLELCELFDVMQRDRGIVRIEEVAEVAGIGVRSLQRLFARYVGVGPKAVLVRYRLQDAVAAIDAGWGGDLAGLAASLGWFDQAHFSRDFRRTVGVTPSVYLAASRVPAEPT